MCKNMETKNLEEYTIAMAEASIQEGNLHATKDPARPRYHFVSPAYMLIDVWGALLHEGYYHLFYDTNYNNDPRRLGGGFAHIRSRDLLHWERLPMALLPDEKVGENGLNDGTVIIDPSGQPLMYYTRCFADRNKHRQHLAVRGSKDLLTWERMPHGEGTMTIENHGGPIFTISWSDPIIFQDKGRTFMIISKCVVPQASEEYPAGDMIPIYEATDDTWLHWEYRGVFANHTGEVLNFFKIGEKWVLIYSPYKNPRYFVGDFDPDTCRFVQETEGTLSHGYVQQGHENLLVSRGFYATASFSDRDNTPCLFGWLSGFNGDGWDGCVSLPRVLSLDEDSRLRMNPHPVLSTLRKEERHPLAGGTVQCGQCFELDLTCRPATAGSTEVAIPGSFTLTVTDTAITFNDITVPYQHTGTVHLRLFVDVSIAELFVDDGVASLSRCFPMIVDENATLSLHGDGDVESCVVYTMEL